MTSKHFKDNAKTNGSFWFKKNTAGVPSTSHKPANNLNITASVSSSNSSSISDLTDELEGYIEDLKSLDHDSLYEHKLKLEEKLRNKGKENIPKTPVKLKHDDTIHTNTDSKTSDEDSDKEPFYGNMHGNILTFEDLVNEDGINQQQEQYDPRYDHQLSPEEYSDEVFTTSDNLPNVHLVTELHEDSIINDSLEQSHSLEFYNKKTHESESGESLSESVFEDNETISEDESVEDNGETSSEEQTSVSEDRDTLQDVGTSLKENGTLSNEYDYSMDFETDVSDDDETTEHDTSVISPPLPRQPVHLKECSVQTEATPIHDPFHNYLNSTPLLPRVVPPEQIEAFTAYTPSSLALQDLVRSQVTLAKHLIDHSKRLSDQLTGSLVPNHHYMTLDDTKEFIASNKPKILTYKEAMKMVRRRDS